MNKTNNLINQMYSFEEDPKKLQDMLSGRIVKENVLDPSISAAQLADQADNPLFVSPQEFANTELSDVETEAQKQTADNKLRRQFTQNTIQPDVSDYDTQKANLAFPDDMGVVESGKQTQRDWDTERNNVNALAAPQNEYEKLQAKMQELRDLEAAQNETASKYNFGAKAAAIIGDTLARYNTGGIQKNAKANIQYTGPKLQEMMGIIGEVKAPGTASQRAELLKEYELLKKAQGGDLSEYQKKSLELRQRQLDAGDKGLGLRKDKFEHARSEGNELKGKEAETLYGIESTIDSLDKLEGMKTFSTGPIEGRINQAMRYIGQGSGNKAAMAAQLEGIVSVYGKQISGTAVGEQEFNRIKSQLPKETDSDELFASKLANFQDNLGNSRSRFLNHYEKVGRDVNQFKERAPLNELKGEAPAAPAARKTVVQNGNRFDAETGEFLGKVK